MGMKKFLCMKFLLTKFSNLLFGFTIVIVANFSLVSSREPSHSTLVKPDS